MWLPGIVLIIATVSWAPSADRVPPAHAPSASGGFLLAQTRQQPFFQHFQDQRPQAAPTLAQPTPELSLSPNRSKQGEFTATGVSGQQYRLVPDPFNAGWYRVEDQDGRTVYQIRPGVRGPGTYETKK
jgi:hypothetical protein